MESDLFFPITIAKVTFFNFKFELLFPQLNDLGYNCCLVELLLGDLR